MVPYIPADEATNRATATQWASGANYLFTYGLRGETRSISHTGFDEDTGLWSVVWELALTDELIEAINENGHAYGKIGSSINSNSEWLLMGTMGGFWPIENYKMFIFD